MAKSVAQICEELFSDDVKTKLQALQELRASNNKGELQQMIEQGDAGLVLVLIGLVQQANQSRGSDAEEDLVQEKVQLEGWHLIVRSINLLPSHEVAARLAHEFGLLDCIVSALQRCGSDEDFVPHVLSCILSLKSRDVKLLDADSSLISVTANALRANLRNSTIQLLVRVLRALSSESAECAEEIQRVVRNRLEEKSKHFLVQLLVSVLACYELETNIAIDFVAWKMQNDPEDWDLQSHLGAIISVLRHGLPFEKCIALICLRFEKNHELASAFVSSGGISVLTSVIIQEGFDLQEHAATCLTEIAKLDAQFRKQIVEIQVEYEHVEILSEDFYKTVLGDASASIDFELFKQLLCSGTEEEQRRALVLLPKNIEVLAVFCFDHGLSSSLSALLLDTANTSEYIKHEAWELLVHIIYELPSIGVAKLPGKQHLASLALRFLSSGYPPMLRKQAILYLAAPLNKCVSVRDTLVNDEGGIPILVELLAREDDNVVANLLSDFLRGLLTASRNYTCEMDVVVRGFLDHKANTIDQKRKVYYQNLLSLYRKPESIVLGHEAADEIENLKLNIETLANGSEVEKVIVLKQLRKFVASWGPIHLSFLCAHIAAIACVLIHEPAELKALAVDVLKTLAAVDKKCSEKVLEAQAQYWSDEPIVSTGSVNAGDEGGDGVDEDEQIYEYSDQESEDEASLECEHKSDGRNDTSPPRSGDEVVAAVDSKKQKLV